MADAIKRLQSDPLFAGRMPPPVQAIGAILRHGGLLHAFGLMPIRLQTPMEVLIEKP